jgi:hypothetical protein
MKPPFSTEQFLGVFEAYNLSVWPLQILFYFLAAVCLYLIFYRNKLTDAIVGGTLSFYWVWMGFVYHGLFFTRINSAAYVFGLFFTIQGILLFYYSFYKKAFEFRLEANKFSILGLAIIVYGLVVYPLIGYFSGHGYPAGPTFGVPCPTTIFTFGILIFSKKIIPIHLLVIPAIWSTIGLSAALSFGIVEDFGLFLSSILTIACIILRKRYLQKQSMEAMHEI